MRTFLLIIALPLYLCASVDMACGQSSAIAPGRFPKSFSPEANYMSVFGFFHHQYWLKNGVWLLPKHHEMILKADKEEDAIILLNQVVHQNPKHSKFVVVVREFGESFTLEYKRVFEIMIRKEGQWEQTLEMGVMWNPEGPVMIEDMTDEKLAERAKELLEKRNKR